MTAHAFRRPAFTPSPALYPFTSRWFDSSAGWVHYMDEGDGPAIVFFHGNPTWSFLYRTIIARLRDRFRCVAADYPGFGLSDRPPGYGYTPAEHARVMTELVRHLGLDAFIVMGQDWGGPIGLAVAVTLPQRVRGVVCGNTWFWPELLPQQWLFSWTLSTPPMQWAILYGNLFVESMPLGAARGIPSAVMDHYRGVQPVPAARMGVAEFPRQIRLARPWLARLAPQVETHLRDKPLLLTWGMGDIGFPAATFIPRWRAAFPDTTVVQLPGARHFIQEDAGDDIARAIAARFLPLGRA